jgi:hypothetical protein
MDSYKEKSSLASIGVSSFKQISEANFNVSNTFLNFEFESLMVSEVE